MPKLLFARLPRDEAEERQVRRLARGRHAPGDWIRRATMIACSWDVPRTTAIAAALGGHPQTVREGLARFDAEGLDGLGAGRRPRLADQERGRIIAPAPTEPAHWSLDALAEAAQARGIRVGRGQVRRIF